MAIAELLSQIQAFQPADEHERACAGEFFMAAKDLALPFFENADPTHVTASAFVVGPQGLLMHMHKRLDRWLQPGGHVNPFEAPEAAAIRETLEETGIAAIPVYEDGQFFSLDVHPGPKGHTHLDLRYLLWADAQPNPPAGESQQVQWFPWTEALKLTEPSLQSSVKRAWVLREVAAQAGLRALSQRAD